MDRILIAKVIPKGCRIERETVSTGYRITVGSNCFDLVGHPTVSFKSSGVEKPIEKICLAFYEGYRTRIYRRYWLSLTKNLGKPDAKGVENGNRFTSWNYCDLHFSAVILGSKATQELVVVFAFGDRANKLWKMVEGKKGR